MKNRTFVCTLFVLILFSLNPIWAQSLNVFGVKAGVHFVDIKDKLSDDSVAHEDKNGFYLGVFMEFRKSVNLSLQPEVYYSANNNKLDEKIGLLHIPFLVKYKLGNSFELFGGPESQFLLSVRGVDINKNKRYKKFILAGVVGVGFLISDEITLEARYNLALSNYIDNGYHTYKKLNFIQVGLAYKFE